MKTCKRGHEWTDENIYMSATGKRCKACEKLRSIKRAEKRALNRKKPKVFAKYTPKLEAKPFCNKGHALTEDNIYVNPRGYVVCRTCKASHDKSGRKAVYQRRKARKRKPIPGSGQFAAHIQIGRGYAGWGQW